MTIPYEGLAGYDAVKRRNQFIVDNVPKMGMAEHSLVEYASLSAAKTVIGTTTKTTLTVSEPHTLSATVDLSDTLITLKFVNDGDIDLNGHTLTVGAIETTGNRQIFKGTGTLRYANGSTNLINLAWRAGNANNADVTIALNEAIASLTYAGGICAIYVPQLSPVTTADHLCESGFFLFGNGNYTTGTNGRGTTLRVKSGATPSYMFKIGEGKACVRFANIVLDADGAANVDGILVEGAEGSGTTVADVSLEHVTLDSFRYGFNHNSTSGAHQLAQTKFDTCIFQGCTTAGLRTKSVNEQIILINTNAAVPAGAMAWKNEGCGLVEWFGEWAATPETGAKGMVISAAHGAINLKIQDEGFEKNLEQNASDITGIINYCSGCLVQSPIELNQSCKVNLLSGCNIMSYAIQGAATGAVVNVQEGVNIREVSVNDGTTVVSPAVLLGAGSGVQIITENLSDLGVFKQRIRQIFFSPSYKDGAATTPLFAVTHDSAISEDKYLGFVGRGNATTGEPQYGYFFRRIWSTGWLEWIGNQADPNKGWKMNFPILSETPEVLIIPVSDETTDLTTGTAKITFRMPYAFHLTAVRASVNTAPTGSTLIVDINEGGTTILSTKLSIDASEKTSVTAASAAVISDADLADDAEITIDIDQIGSTIAGKGLKVMLIGYRV